MKSNHESSRTVWVVASALGMLSSAASHADGGHSVPAGVSAQQHVHLFEHVVVSPSWLLTIGLGAIVLAVLVVKRRQVRAKAS